MNQTHLHLLINHLPVFGSILGALVLAHGLWARSNQTIIAAYNLFIISAVGAVIAYLTGEAAEETVENIQGVSENLIGRHEDAGTLALTALIILGATSLIGLFVTIKKSAFIRMVAMVTLFISLAAFGLVARTGYLGGQIRHTEINSSNTNPQQENKKTEHDD